MYIAGGGTSAKDASGKTVRTYKNEVRKIVVGDVVEGQQGAGLRHHAEIGVAGYLYAYTQVPMLLPADMFS